MKGLVLCIFFTGMNILGFSQNITGQWKGEFLDKSTSFGSWGGDRCEYVIDLDCNGNAVTGFSYTYFTDEGKKFYTICKLTGTFDKKTKSVEITEVERTKTNVPARIRNCFQLHKLTYSQSDSSENLSGTWAPAPNQDGNCGFGITSLYKRTLKSSFPNFNKAPADLAAAKKTVPKPAPLVRPKSTLKPAIKNPASTAKITPIKPKIRELTLKPNNQNVDVVESVVKPPDQKIIKLPASIENRNNNLLKTLEVESESIKVDLYDNGEVDGDSISVYYNNKLLLGKKRLSEKAITLTLPVAANNQVNELVMYAENLGTIPPNTALMVVTDGTKRYEVRITSDLQKSGTIRFVHKANSN